MPFLARRDDVPVATLVPPRVGAIAGLTAGVLWISLFVVGVALYPGYGVTAHWVSDLGHPAAPAPWTLNAACILAGLLFLPFAVALGQAVGGRTGTAGVSVLLVAEAFLIGVGVFPEESPNNMHGIVSIGFFLSLTATVALYAMPLYRSRIFGRVSGVLSVVTLAIAVVFIVTYTGILPNVELAKATEHATIFSALAWAVWNGVRLYTNGTTAAPP